MGIQIGMYFAGFEWDLIGFGIIVSDHACWPCLCAQWIKKVTSQTVQAAAISARASSEISGCGFTWNPQSKWMSSYWYVPTFPNKTSAWCIISWICQLHTMTTGHTWKILTHQATRMISFLFNLMPQTPFLYRPLPVETRSGSRLAAGRFMADAAEAAEAGRLRAFGADAPFDFTFSGSGIEAFFRCPFLLPCFWPLVSVSTLAFQPCHFPTLQLFGEHHLEWWF